MNIEWTNANFEYFENFENESKYLKKNDVQKKKIYKFKKLNIFERNRIQKILKKMRQRIEQLKTQNIINVESFFFDVIISSIKLIMNYQFDFNAQIWTSKNLIKTLLMMNTKIFAINFVNSKYVKKHKISTLFMTKKINFKLTNDFSKHFLI